MQEFTVGLIGCGHMAQHLVAQAASLDGVTIAATCDVIPERAEQTAAKFGAESYTDYGDLLKHPGLNAVIVATPNSVHCPPVIAAAQAGMQIYCEKPMAPTLEECDRMMAAAQAAGVKLMIGQVLRYFPVFHRSHEIIASGMLGDPRVVLIQRTGNVDDPFGVGWRAHFSECGGVLMEVNAHELDFLCHVCGPAKSVFARGLRLVDGGYDYDDALLVQIEFQSGTLACLHASISASMTEYHMTFQCAEGTLINGGFGGPIRYARFSEQPKVIEASDIEMEDPYRHELRLFFEAVRRGEEPPVTGPQARRAVEVALAAYESARSGSPVALPL